MVNVDQLALFSWKELVGVEIGEELLVGVGVADESDTADGGLGEFPWLHDDVTIVIDRITKSAKGVKTLFMSKSAPFQMDTHLV